jgi:hypothetical protein
MFKPTDSDTIQDIRKARSLRELIQITDRIGSKIKQKKSLLSKLVSRLKSLFTFKSESSKDEHIELSDKPQLNINPKSGMGLIENWTFPKSKIGLLKKALEEVDEYNQFIYELESVRSTASRNFPGLKKARLVLKKQVNQHLEMAASAFTEAMTLLESISKELEKSHAPAQLRKWSKQLKNYLVKALPEQTYDLIDEPRLYVSEVKDRVLFQYYITLHGLVDSADYVFTEYYLVLTGAVSSNGVIQFYVTTLDKFSVPGKFDLGRQVKHLADLLKTSVNLLKVDRVLTTLERKPLTLDKDRTKTRLTDIKGVTNVKFPKDELFVFLDPEIFKPGTRPSNAKLRSVVDQVLGQLDLLVGQKDRKNTIFNHRIDPLKNGHLLLKIVMAPAKSRVDIAGTTSAQFNHLVETLGLDVDTARRLKRFLART